MGVGGRFTAGPKLSRVETANNPAWGPFAFIRPDGGVFAAAIADKAQKVVFNGLPPGDYDVEATTGGLHAMRGLRRNVGADGRAETTIDGPSVIAIFTAQSVMRDEEQSGSGQ